MVATKTVVMDRVYTSHLPTHGMQMTLIVALQIFPVVCLFVCLLASFVIVVVGDFLKIFFSFVCIVVSHRASTLSVFQTWVLFL